MVENQVSGGGLPGSTSALQLPAWVTSGKLFNFSVSHVSSSLDGVENLLRPHGIMCRLNELIAVERC